MGDTISSCGATVTTSTDLCLLSSLFVSFFIILEPVLNILDDDVFQLNLPPTPSQSTIATSRESRTSSA